MNETKLLLSPDPGNPNARPDFLATVEPLPRKNSQNAFNLPFEITLDGYTREPWSTAATIGSRKEWKSCHLISTDGRNRLPGFLKFLRERKKAAYAKFEPTDVAGGGRAILVVPFDQPEISDDEILLEGVDKKQLLFVMYLGDESVLTKKSVNVQKQSAQITQQQPQKQPLKAAAPKIPKPIQVNPSKKGGLLGNLLGARQRTENHLDLVRCQKRQDPNDLSVPNTGAAGVISSFRNKVLSELEQFSSDPTLFVTKVTISLSSLVKEVPLNERDKITMDVLKFVVHESVEEIGMDRWIAAKEPGGFMDEVTINIYKEGHCPPEVLEELNKGELPDEVKGQARYFAEAQSKKVQQKDKRQTEELAKKNKMENNVTVLNTNKRDRRTLEQIQKDLGTGEKMSRFDDYE